MVDGKIRKCKHLVRLKSGKTLCRVYKKHLGKLLFKDKKGIKYVCIMRKNNTHDYEGCPYNTEKPMFGEVKE